MEITSFLKELVTEPLRAVLLLAALLLVLVWLRYAVARNERLELNVLGKHVIVVRRVDDTVKRREQPAKDET